MLVPLAQALVAIPFVVRTLLPVLEAIDERLREAAAMLGATPRGCGARSTCRSWAARCWSRPASRSPSSLGEFGATVFLARPDTPTLPVAIARLLGRPGAANFGQAMALSTVLAVTAAAVIARDRTPARPARSGRVLSARCCGSRG